jgi:hypothetical protein
VSRNNSVGIALGYGLDHGGSRVRFPAGAGSFSLHHRVQNGSGAQPASSPMGTRGSFPGAKAAWVWSWPLTNISCRGQIMSGAIPPFPHYAFMAWCLVKAQGRLCLYLCLFQSLSLSPVIYVSLSLLFLLPSFLLCFLPSVLASELARVLVLAVCMPLLRADTNQRLV